MIRNLLGGLMGLIGATAAVWSPFRAWYDGRHGSDYRIEELFSGSGITPDGAALLASLFLPFLVAAILALVAALLRSRLLMAVAGVLVLGFTVLWMVRQGQAAGALTVGGDAGGLGDGVANAFGGGVLMLLGAVVMSGRRRAPRRTLPAHEPSAPTSAHEWAPRGGAAGSGAGTGTGAGAAGPDPDATREYPGPDATREYPGPDSAGAARHPGPGATREYPQPASPDDGHGPVLGSPLHEQDPAPNGPDHGPPLGPPLNKD
ncbi:hypothetical protein ACIQUQ_15105 [Streptomyces sp. NPDC101118]|uniref:hypothetical protein n=1 Tax=Streptomyces sp. NPDC101118 TaxID=3366109 RepID=UPI00381DCAF2